MFAALGFRSRGFAADAIQWAAGLFGIVILGAFLSVLTLHTINDARQEGQVRKAIETALAAQLPGAELLSLERQDSGNTLLLRVRVQVPGSATTDDIRWIQESVAFDLHRKVELTFVGVPTLVLEAIEPPAAIGPPVLPSTVAPTRTSTPAPPEPTPTPTATPTPTPVPPTPPVTGNAGPGS